MKIPFPKNCTLSGRSREGTPLDVDRCDGFLDKLRLSKLGFHDGLSDVPERRDDEPDDVVSSLLCLSLDEFRFMWLLIARMRSGDGGPSIAGSSKSPMLWWSEWKGMVGEDVAEGRLVSGVGDTPSLAALCRDSLVVGNTGIGEYMPH